MTRDEHLAWSKQRALEYVDLGDMHKAYASMVTDLNSHTETAGHSVIMLGMMLLMTGNLDDPNKMR